MKFMIDAAWKDINHIKKVTQEVCNFVINSIEDKNSEKISLVELTSLSNLKTLSAAMQTPLIILFSDNSMYYKDSSGNKVDGIITPLNEREPDKEIMSEKKKDECSFYIDKLKENYKDILQLESNGQIIVGGVSFWSTSKSKRWYDPKAKIKGTGFDSYLTYLNAYLPYLDRKDELNKKKS